MSETSFIVLGLLERLEPATPYDLKQMAQLSTFNFWSVPHTQIYTECARLTEAGMLSEQHEQTGRRRRIYRLTAAGTEELDRWRATLPREPYQLRDPATLRLFFGAEPGPLAEHEVAAHTERLAGLEAQRHPLEVLDPLGDEEPDAGDRGRIDRPPGLGSQGHASKSARNTARP